MKSSGNFAIIAALALTACGGSAQSGNTDTGGPVGFMGARWTASLTAQPGSPAASVSGTGTVLGNSENTQTRVEVTLTGAQADARLPWHLHRGTCGNDQGIVGEASDYAPLTVSSEGQASGSAIVNVPMPTTGEYMINVHASSTDLGTIVACGNLSGPSQ